MGDDGAKRKTRRKSAVAARRALYRDLILDSAEALFAEKGIEASKMDEIAEDAGLALATVYTVFRGKAAIVDALHETRLRELILLAESSATDPGDPVEALFAGGRAFVEYFLAHPSYLRIHVSEGTSWGLPVAGASTRAKAWKEGHRMLARLFERGIAAGMFHADDPDHMANMHAAMQQVTLARWLDRGMVEPPEEVIAHTELQLRRAFCVNARDRKVGD